MNKIAKISILLDMYGNLLTEKQQDVMDLYYNYDLSLGEIAENRHISRQGVRDLIKRGEDTLLDAEDKLGFFDKWYNLSNDLDVLVSKFERIYMKCTESDIDCYNNIQEDILDIKRQLTKIINTI
ncbi:MAG: DNA-binding protein [Xylanivirga thermophila]|jgi:uncharacterized protein|uniref:YlxM family DNA-binding protein n=1 Tax=Xylanivirga thermophila TaxID=2496273 RepID=UPI00101DB653|nr:sigma factor-like helix-turn-helix DNA-binding protein [Xylanivirga thermophila]